MPKKQQQQGRAAAKETCKDDDAFLNFPNIQFHTWQSLALLQNGYGLATLSSHKRGVKLLSALSSLLSYHLEHTLQNTLKKLLNLLGKYVWKVQIHDFLGVKRVCSFTLGQKSSIYPNIHILKISLFTKFTISESHFSQNSHFQYLNFHKIHIFKTSIFTKFTFSKPHFSQNSHFQNLIFHKIHNFKVSFFTEFTF